MRISGFRSHAGEGRAQVSATIHWEECERPPYDLYFETDSKYAECLDSNPHAFLLACIIPALFYGEKRIFLEQEICPELRDGVVAALNWVHHWYYPPQVEIPRIEARVKAYAENYGKVDRAGMLLSGGIDSLAVLRWNRLNFPLKHPGSIKDAFIVQGLHREDLQTSRAMAEGLVPIARNADVELIPIRTNISNFGGSVPWEAQWEGAVLSAVAHVVARRVNQVSIAATLDIAHMYPLGSHPLLDPNYSSSDMRIRHEGITLSRLAKTKLVAEWDTALQNIRVCNIVPQTGKKPAGRLNCGKCEKCIRTMLALLALGALEKTSAFPHSDVSENSVRQIVHLYGPRAHLIVHNYAELIKPLSERGRDDLVRAIKVKLMEYRLYQSVARYATWKNMIKELDQTFLSGRLVALKRWIVSKKLFMPNSNLPSA